MALMRILLIFFFFLTALPQLLFAGPLDNWTSRTSALTDSLRSVAYNRGIFVAAGLNGAIATSPDGSNWTARTSGTTDTIYGMAYGAGTFVGALDNGDFVTSSTGVTWTTRTTSFVNFISSVVFGSNTFVAVGGAGEIGTSPDGATWTSRTSNTTSHLYGVSCGNGLFVAVGSGGRIVTSADAVTWTVAVSGTTDDLNGVGFGNGLFVAVGASGRIVTSRDGISWTKATSGTSGPLWGVGFGSGAFAATGDNGVIITSTDGAVWSPRQSGTSNFLGAVTYGNGALLAVGGSGAVVQSAPLTLQPNLVVNPGFEDGPSGWTTYSSGGYGLIYTIAGAGNAASNWYGYLGNQNNYTEYLYQDLTIPQNAFLQFAYFINTTETLTGVYDKLTAQLENPSTGAVIATVATLSNLNATTAWATTPKYDLTAYAGQTVRLKFKGTTDSTGPSWFAIDDIVLQSAASLDTTAPVVGTFTVPATSNSLTVPVTVAASDAVGVVGYLITETSTPPAPSAAGWGAAPTSYTFTGFGSKTLYAWAKDAAGNVSAAKTAAITLTAPASQTISFTPPATVNLGDAPLPLSATASSNLTVTLTLVSGPATLSGATLTFTGTGSVVVKATQAGNASYTAASDVLRTIIVYPPAGATSNLILNPGFESGHVAWQETTVSGRAIITNSAGNGFNASNWYALLGGANNEVAYLSQVISIPPDATSVSFSAYAKVVSSDNKTAANDSLYVGISDPPSANPPTVFYSLSNMDQAALWYHLTQDLAAYKGKTVGVVFIAGTDAANATSFYLDDVAVNVTRPAAALTVTASAGSGGSITPTAPQSVASGATASFTLTPASGYQIASVTGSCGGSLSGSTYTTAPVTANCSVVASFSQIASIVTPPAVTDLKWQSLGPYGANVYVFAVDPANSQNVYAGTYSGGVYKTSNGGASWLPANVGMAPGTGVKGIGFDPQDSTIIYAGTKAGVFKTTDAGQSWSEISAGLTTKDINTLIVDPTDGKTLYVGTQGGGVFKTSNGGTSWGPVNGGFVVAGSDFYSYALAIDPANHQTIYAGTGNTGGGKVFKSTDGGANWSATGSGTTMSRVFTLVLDPSSAGTLFAGTGNSGIYRTTDGGATWQHLTNGPGLSTASITQMAIDKSTPKTVYAGAYQGGVYKSIDGGNSWLQSNSGLTNTDVYAIAVDPGDSRTIYTGTYAAGTFKSVNGGQTWSPTGVGLTNAYVVALALDPGNAQTIYAGTSFNALHKSANGGATWTALGNNLPYDPNNSYGSIAFVAVDPSNSQTAYASGYNATTFISTLYKTTNGGAAWTTASSGLTAMADYLLVDPGNPQTVYAATLGGGVFKSVNGGSTWSASNTGLADLQIYSLAFDRANSQIVYAGASGKVYKSVNGGGNWSSISSGLAAGKAVYALLEDPSNALNLFAGSYGGGVYRSSDGGASWAAVNAGLANLYVTSLVMDPGNAMVLYAGTRGGGVFRSVNGGVTWSALNDNLYDLQVNSLAIDPANSNLLYAGTWGSGVYKTLTSDDVPILSGPGSVTFAEGSSGRFQVASSGWPAPVFSVSGVLPAGVSFDATTGTFSGTPASGSAGDYPVVVTASNGIPPDATKGIDITVLPASPLTAVIAAPVSGSALNALGSITGTASGSGLAKVELQIGDGAYYLQQGGAFSTTPAWLAATGTSAWSLNTASVKWVEGRTYTVSARSADATGKQSQPAAATFAITVPAGKAVTVVSLTVTADKPRAGDSVTLTGSLLKNYTDAASLQPVTLIVTPPPSQLNPKQTPVIVPVTTDGVGAFTSGPLLAFNIPGVYTVQARYDGSATLAASSSSQVVPVTPQSGYAVIVTGKASDNSQLAEHSATTDAIYATLVNKRGFLPQNISYLKSTASAAVTRQQLQAAIANLAGAQGPLYLIMVDHGSPTGFLLGDDTITPADLKGWLDALERDPTLVASGYARHIIIGSCYSGIFAAPLSKAGRVIITSANVDEQSISGFTIYNSASGTTLNGGEYFIDNLFNYLGRGDSVKDAFTQARDMVALRDPRKVAAGRHADAWDTLAQHPLLDDAGSGVPSYTLQGTANGAATALEQLGVGVHSLGDPADITAVTATANLPISATGDVPLWLQVGDNSRIAKAWIEIRTPVSSVSSTGSTGQVIPHLVTLPLYYDGSRWNGSYSFPNAGTYNILYYTQDNETLDISPAAHSLVYRQLANNPAPSSFSLTAPADEDSVNPMFPLSWQEVTSNSSVTYTLLVATDPSFNSVVYKAESIPQAGTFIADGKLKNPANNAYYCQNGDSYCYWKVQAIDRYGAVTESNTRSFTVTATNGLPGVIDGYLTDSVTGAPIVQATIKAGSTNAFTYANGAFLMVVPTGNYNVSVTSAAGYQLKSRLALQVTAGKETDASMSLTSTTPVVKQGDCNGDTVVSADEVKNAINMFLGVAPVLSCVDKDGAGGVSASEVQKVVNWY